MSGKHTHRGHCQACGRLQAVQNHKGQTVAKHGYVVRGWGFFNGTCDGSDKMPMENSREYTDSVIRTLHNHALGADDRLEAFKSGKSQPLLARSGKHRWDAQRSRTIYEMVPFAEAPVREQEQAVTVAINEARHDAEMARAHIVFLTELAAKVHGKELVPADRVKPAIAVGDKVKVYGRIITVALIENRIARGVGPALNGTSIEHCVTAEGKAYPKRFCRLVQS